MTVADRVSNPRSLANLRCNRVGPAGRGAPSSNTGLGRRVLALRCFVTRAYDGGRVLGVMDALEKLALNGDVAAAKVFLETLLGKPKYADDAAPAGHGGINIAVVFGAPAPGGIDSGQFQAGLPADSISLGASPG